MPAVVTPCRGRPAVYDAVTSGSTTTEKRREARIIAAALCGQCPIAATCPDRVTPPTKPHRRKAKTVTEPEKTPVPAATPPTAPAVIGTQELIAWGQRHPSSRVQTLAARARTSLIELARMREREKAVTAAEARVKELQEQLAEEQAKLRAAKGAGAAPTATVQPKRGKEESLRIRQWARENGHDVPVAGILPRRIIDAYEAAHQQLAATA